MISFLEATDQKEKAPIWKPNMCPAKPRFFDTKSQKSPSEPKARKMVNESIVEADKGTEVEVDDDLDFDENDVDVRK